MVGKFHDKDDEFFQKRPETVLSICRFLAPLMNEVHGTEFSEKFWTRLLIPYAWAFYNQQENYSGATSRFPVPFEPMTGWNPPRQSQIYKDQLTTTLRSFKGKYLLARIAHVLPENGKIALGIRGEIVATELDLKFVSFNWIPFLGLADHQPRKLLASIAKDLDSPVGGWLVTQMPRLYLEYLGGLLAILRRIKSFTITDVYMEHYGNFFDRLLACFLGENGASLNQLQLGGYIGETTQSVDVVTRAQRDKHLTYGWRINPEDTPFYGIRLEQFGEKYRNCRNTEKKWDLLVIYNQVASNQTRNYYEDCSQHLRNDIDIRQYPKILLRPRGSTRLVSARRSLDFLKGSERYEISSGKEDIAELCASSKLVVQWSHPSTNFLECIFVDQPIVAVLLNDSPTDIVRSHYDFLREVGILHSDSASLIAHVNKIDVESWWADVLRCKEYELFKQTFARSKSEYLAA